MSTELAIVGDWGREEIDLIKKMIAPDISDQELKLFSMICQRTQLDPFSRQIYAVMRNVKVGDKWEKKMTIQTGIDGYRVTATRSGALAGIDDVIYDNESGEFPNKAQVTVYRIVQGVRCPFTATARWSEYVIKDGKGNLTGKWRDMPYLMLGKCAEALALRKAFPSELSGIYTDAEMDQADIQEPAQQKTPAFRNQAPLLHTPKGKVEPVTDSREADRKRLEQFCKVNGYSASVMKTVKQLTGLTEFNDFWTYINTPSTKPMLQLLTAAKDRNLDLISIVSIFRIEHEAGEVVNLAQIQTAANLYIKNIDEWDDAMEMSVTA